MLTEEIRGAAFRRLLRTGSAASIEELAADLNRSAEDIERRVRKLGRQGRARLDDGGSVTGSAGLSIGPDRHRIDIGSRRFWTWCAYDSLGIFGALWASGEAHSTSPLSGTQLHIHFRHRPLPTHVVLFRPDETYLSCCNNVYEEWCPSSNFFEGEKVVRTWSSNRRLSGRVLALDEAAGLATSGWESVAGGLRM